jgi:hypothetical protein
MRLTGNAFHRAERVNFLNPERRFDPIGGDRVTWSSVTTGNFAGVDLWLDEPKAGRLSIDTKPVTTSLLLADIGEDDTIIEAGGLGKRLRAFRMPSQSAHRAFAFNMQVQPAPVGDSPIYVRVTLEDGHQAWSSPIYVIQ